MASIFNPEYKDGHKVLIKDKTMLRKVGSSIPALVSKSTLGITPGKTVFELIKTKSKQKNPKHTIVVSPTPKGNLEAYMMKSGTSQKYLFIGAKSSLQNMFTHAGDGKSSKSDTDDKTATKELASLCLFEQKLKYGNDVDYDFVHKCLPKKLQTFFTEDYFTSAQKQLKLWLSKEKGRFKGRNFVFERQLDNLTKKIYKNALSISKLNKDNWNPGDIWIVKKDLDFTVYENSTSIQQINKQLVQDYKDGCLASISLKQINPNQNGSIDYINLSATKKKEVKFDFTFKECDFSAETFKNAIIYSESGFGPRMGFKASTSGFGVYLEGRFKGAGSQVGAIDATKIPEEIKKRYNYTIRKGGTPDLKVEEPIALKEMKEMIKRHGAKKISNGLDSYKHFLELYDKAPLFQKQRFCRISSFMYPYLELSFDKGDEKEFKDLMSWSYSLAKKETDVGGFYIFLGP
jgi:hypothetical protein